MSTRSWMGSLFGKGDDPSARGQSPTSSDRVVFRPGHGGRVTRATLNGHFLDVSVDIRAWLNRAGMAVEVTCQEGCRGNRLDGPRFVDWYALGNFDPGGTDGTWWGGELLGATGQQHAFSARNPERTSPWNRFVSAHVDLTSDSLRGLRSTEVLDWARSKQGAHVVLPRHPDMNAQAQGFELSFQDVDAALAACAH